MQLSLQVIGWLISGLFGLGKSADKMKNVAGFPNDSLILTKMPYTVKKLFDIPVVSRDVTYQSLPGRE